MHLGQPAEQNLVGKSNESTVLVHGQEVNALIDSGSMVTTVSESFFNSIPDKPPLQDLKSLLQITIADGSKLDYLGYIDTSVSVPFL